MTRDERQALTIKKWKDSGGQGVTLLPTGFGKSRVALNLISQLKEKNSNFKCLLLVPSDYLLKQWKNHITRFELTDVVTISTVHSAVNFVNASYHLIVADEVHMFCSPVFIEVFNVIKHKYFLGLTATLERLDGREKLLLKKYPIIDYISLQEAIDNEWVSEYKQYKVELNVDLSTYNKWNTQFLHHFAFFDHNFTLAMACSKDKNVRIRYASFTGQDEKTIHVHAIQFMRAMSNRKNFIYNHLDKIRLTNLIINSRTTSKIVTFTKYIKHAKLVCCGSIYHSEMKQKAKDKVVEEFNAVDIGVLNTCKALDMGADIEGVDVGIIMSGDSSNISKKQKVGRVLRYKPDKVAELFTFVIKNTVEESWFEKSNKDLVYEVLQDYQLEDYLNGNEIKDSIEEEKEFIFIL